MSTRSTTISRVLGPCMAIGIVFLLVTVAAATPPLFDGPLSRATLDRILSRSITLSDLLRPDSFFDERGRPGCWNEQLRLIRETRPLLLGRALYPWGDEVQFLHRMATVGDRIEAIHAVDDRIVVQAAIFEIVSSEVNQIPVPIHVLEAFGLQTTDRTFHYPAMLFPEPHRQNQFGIGLSVPDLTALETRLWYYFLAASFIDRGFEAIHLGQLEWVAEDDTDRTHTAELIAAVRAYAGLHARRHWVLLDAHTAGMTTNGHLLLDFHSAPLRLFLSESSPVGVDVGPRPDAADSAAGLYDSSLGGRNPSGWTTAANPFLVELDHGYSRGARWLNTGPEFIDGLDEITWFAEQPLPDRNAILRYLHRRVRQLDSAGHLQVCGLRPTWVNHTEHPEDWYIATTPSPPFPWGFDQETTIATLWHGARRPGGRFPR